MASAVARAALGAAALAALLAGCRMAPAPAPGPGADAPWPEQRAALERLDQYSLTGRVAVAARGEGFSGALRYQQQPHRSDLSLDGPLGMGGFRVVLDGDQLAISTSRGAQLDGAAARAELEQSLGFSMPMAALRWWLLGIPAPGEASLDADAASGEIRGFMQDGWKISIDARAPALGFALPRRLTATREGARMKLLVDRWQ
ncbi:MAG TPA: lipoprotein insertase outer membrane protein LolB [Steroidobacteraceae bacterium]|nr:lipoprotein insertase outer membrane protein LolB [Steroidobacteraceae bacterium]